MIVVGAGAAGLFCALVAADAGASVALVSRTPLAGSASYWAQGGIAAALAVDDSAERHAAGHHRGGPRRGPAQRGRRAVPGLARPRPRPRAHGRALRRRPPRRAGPGPGGRALGAPDRARRRVGHRPADHAPAVGAGRAPRARPGDGGHHRHRRCWCRTGAAWAWRRARRPGRWPWPPAAPCWPPAGRRRCGRARPTRPARSGSAWRWPTPRAPAWPTSSSCSSTPPRWSATAARDGFLITEAVRGEGALLLDAERRAVRGRAGAARPGGAGHRGAPARAGHALGGPGPAAGGPGPLPQHRRRAGRRGHRPRPGPGAGRPGLPLHDGRRGHRPGRARLAGRPAGRGRVRVHRPARGQPAGLQLAGRVLRAGPPRRAGGLDAPGEPPALAAAEAASLPDAALRRHPGRAVAPRRPAPQPGGAARAGRRPVPAGPPDRGRRAGPRGEPRRAPARGPPGHRPRAGRPPRRCWARAQRVELEKWE